MRTAQLRYLSAADISPAQEQQLMGLLSSCFLGPENSMFLRQSYWRERPQHRMLYEDESAGILAQAAGHEKLLDGREGKIKVLGISEVAVSPALRGQGISKKLLEALEAWAQGQGFAFAMLFGPAKLYGPLGYQIIENEFRHQHWPSGQLELGRLAGAQIKLLAKQAWPEGLIDLNGPAW